MTGYWLFLFLELQCKLFLAVACSLNEMLGKGDHENIHTGSKRQLVGS